MPSHKIQLTIDKELDAVLTHMKLRFPALKEGDLLKMATSGFYSQNRHLFLDDVQLLDDATSKVVETAKKELASNKPNKVYSSAKELLSFIKK
jgi:hypothetical protein